MQRVAGWVTPFLLAAALIGLGLPSLRHYNVNWDEGLGDLFFGQRYLSYFTTLDRRYLQFEADPYPPGHVPDLSSSPFRDDPASFYPVANTLAAAVSAIVSGRLGLLDPFDGFHAANLLFGAVLVFAMQRYLAPRFGAATAAVLFACALVLGLAVFFAAWPYLWSDPVPHIGKNLRYLLMQKLVVGEESSLVAPLRLRPDIQLLPITDASSPAIAPEEIEGLREVAGRRHARGPVAGGRRGRAQHLPASGSVLTWPGRRIG